MKHGDLWYCDFCAKSQKEVRQIVTGPTACVCNECVNLCLEVIKGEDAGEREYQSWLKA